MSQAQPWGRWEEGKVTVRALGPFLRVRVLSDRGPVEKVGAGEVRGGN